MTKMNKKMVIVAIVLTIMCCLSSGCVKTSSSSEENLSIPPVSAAIEGNPDIVLPSDMKQDVKNSMTVRTESFIGGQYKFSGKVEMTSLRDFIKASMANNKWKLVGEVNYHHTMLAFIKPNKTCLMTLSESFGGSMGSTVLDMSVTVDVAAAKNLNAFGEPSK